LGWSTKNPPKKSGRYLITLKTSLGNQVRSADRNEYPAGYWTWSLLPHGSATDSDVLAWMKEPAPYSEK